MKLYDRFAEEFIDEKERNMYAPPERYEEISEHDYHLKDVKESFDKCFDRGYETGYKQAKKVFERPHGEWIKFTLEGGFLSSHKCSKCGFHGNQLWHFCPNCGASMQKEGDEK